MKTLFSLPNFPKLIFTLILLFCFPGFLYSDSEVRMGKLTVFAKGGLALREEPNPNGKKILVIPQYDTVQALNEVGETITIGGWEGEFQKVQYKGKTGYVFNPYLSVLPKPPKDCSSLEDYVKRNFKILKKETEEVESGYIGTVTNYNLIFKNGNYSYEYKAKENNFYTLFIRDIPIKYTDMIHVLKSCQYMYHTVFNDLNSENATDEINGLNGSIYYRVEFNCEPLLYCRMTVHQWL